MTPDYASLGKQAGRMLCPEVDTDEETASAVRNPEILRFSVNLKTARRIGLTMPSNMVSSAAEIFD